MPVIQIIAQITVLVCFLIIAYLFSQEKYDVTGWVLFFGIFCSIFTALIFPEATIDFFFDGIPTSSLIYLVFMDIFIKLLINQHVFEYLAIKKIRFTRARIRLLFYLICLATALISGIMEDVSVAIILHPIIFRTTKFMKTDSKPFIYGSVASIILGNLLTPFAAPMNIIFSSSFNLNLSWYIINLYILFVIGLVVILFFIDYKNLKKAPKPKQEDIKILVEIMNPNFLIKEKGRFYRYMIYLIFIFIGLIINIYPYIFIAFSVVIITLLEEHGFTKLLNNISWNLPFLYIGLFLLIGCIKSNGSIDVLQNVLELLIGNRLILAIFIILILGSIISSFFARSLALIIFITIFNSLFMDLFPDPNSQRLLLMTLIVGLQLGGNLVPQSSTFILKSMEQIKERNLPYFQYSTTANAIRTFTLIELPFAVSYLFVYGFILGVF